jgi:hypothetical protein
MVDVDAVYTFGMPRPDNQAFADLYYERPGSRTCPQVHGRYSGDRRTHFTWFQTSRPIPACTRNPVAPTWSGTLGQLTSKLVPLA